MSPLADTEVVALGGGHGLSASLSALRRVVRRPTAVVTVADDGGSSGRLRREFGVLPPGDLRQALAALCSDDEWGQTWARVLQHRFASSGEMNDHAVGNVLILALWELLGGHVEGLDWVGRLLGAQGRVLPMSLAPMEITATVRGEAAGAPAALTTVRGQVEVATTTGEVVSVDLVPASPPGCPDAVHAVENADWLVFGPGSWFTSVIPHLLVPDLRAAAITSRARTLVTLNLEPQPGETAGFSPQRHLEVLGAHAPGLKVDAVLADGRSVSDADGLRATAATLGAELVVADVADEETSGRHDQEKLARAYASILGRA